MFAQAVQRAKLFTYPLLTAGRLVSGRIFTQSATFMLLNSEGWLLTAAHALEPWRKYEADRVAVGRHQFKMDAIACDPALSDAERRERLEALPPDPGWIRNLAMLWGPFGSGSFQAAGDPVRDLAFVRLEGFAPPGNQVYPIFRDPDTPLRAGTSLCKLGFPFTGLEATFDEGSETFSMVTDLPFFPLDGIYTRSEIRVAPESGRRAEFIETSTPGLPGQSGGPVLDVEGRVCGMQSHSHRLVSEALPVEPGTRESFSMTTGLATHSKEIIEFARLRQVALEIG